MGNVCVHRAYLCCSEYTERRGFSIERWHLNTTYSRIGEISSLFIYDRDGPGRTLYVLSRFQLRHYFCTGRRGWSMMYGCLVSYELSPDIYSVMTRLG